MNKFSNYMYYLIVGVVSLIVMFVFPMMGSEVGLEFKFPTTIAGWVVYVGTNLITATANMIIFFSFMQQAKVNVKEEEHYVEANEILIKLALKQPQLIKKPRSPRHWQSSEYGKKGSSIFLCSILSCLAMTNAILRFDYVALISYVISVIFAIIFGLFQMKVSEQYWTDEYYRYAKFQEKLAQDMENEGKKEKSFSLSEGLDLDSQNEKGESNNDYNRQQGL